MSFKRARTLEQIGGSVTIDAEQEPEDAEYREAAGKRFRQYLLERYSTGRATASETCTLAFLHSESGGQGTDDIGLPPEQASRHGTEHLRLPDLGLAFFFGSSIRTLRAYGLKRI